MWAQFCGISEGSGGNVSQDSPADYPVVQLESLGNEQTVFLLSTNWSANTFTSAALTGFTPGYALVTMFVNGIPSPSRILSVAGPVLPFQITSIAVVNVNDLLITWNTGGISNFVQVSAGAGASGSYSTTTFADVTNLAVTAAMMSFWDVGAATNTPARYYRIRSPQ